MKRNATGGYRLAFPAMLAVTIYSLNAFAAKALDSFDIDRWAADTAYDERYAITVLGGSFVKRSMTDIFLKGNIIPFEWDLGEGGFMGFAVSRPLIAFLDRRAVIEAEFGTGKRFGNQTQSEVWSALFIRYTDFPWNDKIFTTVAVSTGLNWASSISEVERKRSGNGRGDRLLHYLAPEITFARPVDPSKELVIRFHHRSGAMGIVSETDGGAQYITAGLRFRF